MKKIFLFVFIISFPKLQRSMEVWKDKLNFLDYDDSANFDEKCIEGEMCPNFEDSFKRKPKEMEAFPFANEVDMKKTRSAPYYHSARPIPCSCGIEFRLLDLGHLYYPRYLHTGVCKSEGCGGLYRCMEKHYKVRVLKQRDPRNTELKSSLALPENLKNTWQTEQITVTVACECTL